jgi:hypothetical protein
MSAAASMTSVRVELAIREAMAALYHALGRGTQADIYQAQHLSSLASTPLQEGQTKMSFSGHTPNFAIVRRCFMVSPQERHTRVRVLSDTG